MHYLVIVLLLALCGCADGTGSGIYDLETQRKIRSKEPTPAPINKPNSPADPLATQKKGSTHHFPYPRGNIRNPYHEMFFNYK